ncbi:MAG: hypothetical protein STSR0009_04650 [Methanoregula sp.]
MGNLRPQCRGGMLNLYEENRCCCDRDYYRDEHREYEHARNPDTCSFHISHRSHAA